MSSVGNKYRYWNLIKEIALTDFKLKYQGSILGYAWSLAKPLAEFTVLYFVFTKIFKVGGSIEHYPIYLLLGVLMFSFWSDATATAMQSITSRGDLLRKVYFPRIVLVFASTMTAFINFLLNSMIVLVFAYFNNLELSFSMLGALVYFFEFYLFVLGVSFYLSALFVKFRDISYIWEVVNRVLFYATPILYTITLVPTNIAKIMVLSPLANIILEVRRSFLGEQILTTSDFWRSGFIAHSPELLVLFILITGYFIFNKMAAKFAEEV